MDKTLSTLEKFSLYLTIFLLPIVVLPIFPNPFGAAKVAVLAFGVALTLLFCSLRTIFTGKIELSLGKFDIGVIVLALAFLVSAILRTPNRMEAFFLPGTATTIIASTVLYFLILKNKTIKDNILITLFISGIFVAVFSLLAYSGILSRVPQLPAFMKDANFTTLGGNLPTIIFLGTILPLSLGVLLKEKESSIKAFAGVSLVVMLLSVGLLVFNMLPGKAATPRLPSFNTSWAITVDTLKERPFLGIGPGNYLSSFNRFRPLAYNQTDLWNLRFTSARDFYLTVITETGLAGALGLAILLFAVYRYLSSNIDPKNLLTSRKGAVLSLIVLLVLLALFSAGTTLIALLFILLALNSDSRSVNLNFAGQANASAARIPALIVTLPVIAALLAFGYFGTNVLRAEAKFKQSIDALAQNQGTRTYDLLNEAIQINPNVDRYRANYARVNLALAQNIAQQEEITDQDRQTVAQLIQQSIREAKATVTLNPQRAGNWQLLANTYRSIIAFAQGADTFALQSYNQAIALDPINPNLRISLGGLYYALGNYDQAIRAFEFAVIAKPDLANAHYNLAAALREKGDIEAAINEMTTVLSLVDQGTEDYEIARAELEALENAQVSGDFEEGDALQPPQPGQEQVIKPPLDLPEDSNPPEAPESAEEIDASPSPSPTQ